jgi:hypothetical protein
MTVIVNLFTISAKKANIKDLEKLSNSLGVLSKVFCLAAQPIRPISGYPVGL